MSANTGTRITYKYFFLFLGLLAVLYFLARYIIPIIWHLL